MIVLYQDVPILVLHLLLQGFKFFNIREANHGGFTSVRSTATALTTPSGRAGKYRYIRLRTVRCGWRFSLFRSQGNR